ncbi:MAG: glycosyltransferase [Candidatus Roizmanbacteria bacterium]|nr:glycosyltransferase [Candidatus Roizmanbacteria bacterium]
MESVSKPLPLTIVTAVLNEEQNLPAFLEYATNLAQEVIVVVDFRTTDQSAEIARNAGCKILIDKGESKGIVFTNKNWGIREASHTWVLILDTDERPDTEMEQELERITMHDPDSEVNMYQTGFINIEFGQKFDKCDQKHKKFIRLVRKGTFEYNTGKTAEGFGIHSNGIGNSFLLKIPLLRSWVITRNPQIKNLKGYIIHNSHPTIKDFIRKINHYSTREAKILFERNPEPSIFLLTLKLFFNPLREFIQKYFIWKMYKEGARGAIASILYSFYHFLIIAKYLQLIFSSPQPQE